MKKLTREEITRVENELMQGKPQQEINIQGDKPIIQLEEIVNHVVHTPTKEDFDTLMRIYEAGGWTRWDNLFPTCKRSDVFSIYKKETCVNASNLFTNTSRNESASEKLVIMTTQDFYHKQQITPEIISEINKYFKDKDKIK